MKWSSRLLLALAIALAPSAAQAACGAIPYVFTAGVSTIAAATTNQNNQFLLTCATTVDNTQIGAAGLFASQLVPTSGLRATFGGTYAYGFPNGLTASGGNVAPFYNAAGAAWGSLSHTAIISSITTSGSLNTGCPPHGTWTGWYCGSAVLSSGATFTSNGSSAGTATGNTMPSYSCSGPWANGGLPAHLFGILGQSNVLIVIDDTVPNTIYLASNGAVYQTGPIICTGG